MATSTDQRVPDGVVHELPTDLREALTASTEALEEGKRRPCCWPGCKHRERRRP